MSNVINKSTLEYREFVNTPDYKDGNWIINPVLPSCPKKYWKVSGNSIVEMNNTEKQAKDTADALALRHIPKSAEQIASELDKATTGDQGARFMTAFNENAIWGQLILAQNYIGARALATQLVSGGTLIQADYDLIDSILPLQE